MMESTSEEREYGERKKNYRGMLIVERKIKYTCNLLYLFPHFFFFFSVFFAIVFGAKSSEREKYVRFFKNINLFFLERNLKEEMIIYSILMNE